MKIGEHNYIQQLQRHNENALMYVIDEYGGLLMSVIRKHLFTMPQKQEECFNDVLLKIWENIGSFDGERSSFKNWAAAVARYRAIDCLRQYQKELSAVDIEDVVIPREDAAIAALLEQEISEETQRMLQCLAPGDRELFWKLYVEEETMEQVSRETGMEKAVIYNRLSRGRKKIRKNFSLERGV